MKQKHYILKVLPKNLKAHGDFQWPNKVEKVVTAPDWNPTPICGGGLHGWLDGIGDSTTCDDLMLYQTKTPLKWLVLSTNHYVNIDNDKVKCKSCVIEYIGNQQGASKFLAAHSPIFSAGLGIGKVLTSKTPFLIAHGGDYCKLTGGDNSNLIGKDTCTLTGGDYSTLMGGRFCKLRSGNNSVLVGGNYCELTGKDNCTLTGGGRSNLIAGNNSTLVGGIGSVLIGGVNSSLMCEENSIVMGDTNSSFIIKCYTHGRLTIFTATVGKNGIKPNVKYILNDKNKFIPYVE